MTSSLARAANSLPLSLVSFFILWLWRYVTDVATDHYYRHSAGIKHVHCADAGWGMGLRITFCGTVGQAERRAELGLGHGPRLPATIALPSLHAVWELCLVLR
jgi:hypothetical protein